MTNAELIAKIKAEIGKRILAAPITAEGHQRVWAYNDVIDLLSTLESEKPMNQEGLEEEIERCVIEPYYDLNGVAVKGATAYLTVNDVADIARHFAEWGYLRAAEKYNEIEYNRQRAEESVPNDLEEAANKFAVFYDQGTCDGIAQDCFKAGAKWDREKMMEEAVEGVVINDSQKWVFAGNDAMNHLLKDYKAGDKVCVIILPKED